MTYDPQSIEILRQFFRESSDVQRLRAEGQSCLDEIERQSAELDRQRERYADLSAQRMQEIDNYQVELAAKDRRIAELEGLINPHDLPS